MALLPTANFSVHLVFLPRVRVEWLGKNLASVPSNVVLITVLHALYSVPEFCFNMKDFFFSVFFSVSLIACFEGVITWI